MTHNQTSNSETAIAAEPQGDLGQGHEAWASDQDENGIPIPPGRRVRAVPETDSEDDAAAFADDEEDDDDDDDVDDDEEFEEEEEDEDEDEA